MKNEFKVIEIKDDSNSYFRILISTPIFPTFRKYLGLDPKYKYKPLTFKTHHHVVNNQWIITNLMFRCSSINNANSMIDKYVEYRSKEIRKYRGYKLVPIFVDGSNNYFELSGYCPQMYVNSGRFNYWYKTFSEFDKFKHEVDKLLNNGEVLSEVSVNK